MPKDTSDDRFIAELRERKAAASKPPEMYLRPLPARSGMSRSEMLDQQDRADAERRSFEQVPTAAPVERDLGHPSHGDRGFFIPLSDLKSHEWNARVYRPQTRVVALAREMAATRQNHPISVVKDPDAPSKYFIVDGETRRQAAAFNKWPEIWAIEVEVDPRNATEFYAASYQLTAATEQISQIDQGLKWAGLVAGGFGSYEDVASRLGLSKATVIKMAAFARFPAACIDFMREHSDRFPYSVASELVSKAEEAKADSSELLRICELVVAEKASRRSVESLVKKATGRLERRERKSAELCHPVMKGATKVGALRTYPTGAIDFRVGPGAELNEQAFDDVTEVLKAVAEFVTTGTGNLAEMIAARLHSENR